MARHWIVERNNLNGHTNFPGASVTDLQTANDITTLILSGASTYPITGIDGATLVGYIGTPTSISNATFSQAGGQTSPSPEGYSPTLSGVSSLTTGAVLQVALTTAGEYDIWAAFGSTSASSAERCYFFEGTYDALANGVALVSYGIATGSVAPWAASTVMGTGAFRAMPDLSVWEKLNTGNHTSGTVAPSAAGKVFGDQVTDGAVTWRFSGRYALIAVDGVSGASSNIVDQNGAARATGTWPSLSAPIRVSIGSQFGGIGFVRVRANTSVRPRCTGFQLVPPILADLAITDVVGRDQLAGQTFYSMQPVGKAVAKIQPSTGLGTAAAITLTGTLASYFEVTADVGGALGLRQLTPIPDGLSLPHTLAYVQTSPGATGSPRTTTPASITLVSSQGRPFNDGTWQGAIRTENWLNHYAILAKHETWLWKGLLDQADPVWDTNVTVNSAAALLTAMAAARTAAIASGRTTKHKIRLLNGTYSGPGSLVASFGTGMLVIEPEAGNDPSINMEFDPFNVGGVHIRGLKITADQAVMGDGPAFQGTDVGSGGIDGTGDFARIVFENIRFGAGFAGADDTQIFDRGNSWYSSVRAQSVVIRNSVIDGGSVSSCLNFSGTYAWLVDGLLAQRMIKDLIAYAGPSNLWSTLGVFGDDGMWGMCLRVISRREPDHATFLSEAHADFLQGRTVEQNASFWWANNIPNDQLVGAWSPLVTYSASDRVTHAGQLWKPSSTSLNEEPGVSVKWGTGGAGWVVGETMFCRESNRWYEVATLTTAGGAIAGVSGATPPSSTGTGIADGGVTWDFLSENVLGTDWYLSAAECIMVSNRTASTQASNRQFHIGSNSGHGSRLFFSCNQCITAHFGDKGIEFDEGELFAEFNLFAGPPAANAAQESLVARISFNSDLAVGYLENNLTKAVPKNLYGALVWSEKSVVLNWDADSPVVGTRPQDFLAGPFTSAPYDDGTFYGWTLQNDGLNTRDEFRYEVMQRLKVISGTAGPMPYFRIPLDVAVDLDLVATNADDVTVITTDAPTVTAGGAITMRWKKGAAETGATTGADITLDIT